MLIKLNEIKVDEAYGIIICKSTLDQFRLIVDKNVESDIYVTNSYQNDPTWIDEQPTGLLIKSEDMYFLYYRGRLYIDKVGYEPNDKYTEKLYSVPERVRFMLKI